ncbi:MAG: YigZ family protein [Ignavibacteriales bacterium]|nr:YigZ family protein [Ignavibacteriales bacterium]
MLHYYMIFHYDTIADSVQSTIKIVGSRFVASAFPVTSEQEASVRLEEVRRELFDATHHCHAYMMDPDGKRQRSSDAGEPSGTAGAKILSAIRAAELSDVLVIVTRYFGGTKLGVGGLGRAYFDAAQNALHLARRCTRQAMKPVTMTFPYDATSAVMNLLHRHGAVIGTSKYDSVATLHLLLPLEQADQAMMRLTEATAGRTAFASEETVVWHMVNCDVK